MSLQGAANEIEMTFDEVISATGISEPAAQLRRTVPDPDRQFAKSVLNLKRPMLELYVAGVEMQDEKSVPEK